MNPDKVPSNIDTPGEQTSSRASPRRKHPSFRQPSMGHWRSLRDHRYGWFNRSINTENIADEQDNLNTNPDWEYKGPPNIFWEWHHRVKPAGTFMRSKRMQHHPRGVFFRLVFVFGAFIALVVGTFTILVSIIRYLMGSFQPIGEPWLIIGIGIMLLFGISMAATQMGRQVYNTVASPLADLLSATEAVTDGDLSVRLSEDSGGRFSGVVKTFNKMVSALERADQQRRNLTADVAHELRTPLQIIQGNLEGVLDGVYDPTPQHIEATLEATHQLSRLVQDLRTLSLAETGQLTLQFAPINIEDLLLDTQTTFSGFAEDAGIDLRVAVSNDVVTDGRRIIHADPGRLDQVLANLVVNAVRHTPQGGTITLQANTLPDGIEIRVSDTGEGISVEDLPFIFDRFWRGDRARTHHEGTGSGLGLAITRQLVRLHGGTIDVNSTLGKGTTFILHLPFTPPNAG